MLCLLLLAALSARASARLDLDAGGLDLDAGGDAEALAGLAVTYESCQASLGAAARTLARPRWLHVPKAGTSFAATLFAYVCDAGPENATEAELAELGLEVGVHVTRSSV
jgi:hypothetical protein